MPESHPIKWRKVDLQKARQAVKKFNAKIDYWKKKNPGAEEYLPEKLTLAEIKKDVKTRKDFNRLMKELQAFQKRGAEKLITPFEGAEYKVTQWEAAKVKKATAKINRIRKQQAELAKSVAVKVGGESFQPAELKQIEQRARPIKPPSRGPQQDWKRFAEWAEKEARQSAADKSDIFKDHLTGVIEANKPGFDKNQQRELIRLLNNLGSSNCIALYLAGIDEFNPSWVYDEPIDSDLKFRRMRVAIAQQLRSADFLIDSINKSNMNYEQKSEIIDLINSDVDYALDKYLEGREELDEDWLTNTAISADEHYNRLIQLLT